MKLSKQLLDDKGNGRYDVDYNIYNNEIVITYNNGFKMKLIATWTTIRVSFIETDNQPSFANKEALTVSKDIMLEHDVTLINRINYNSYTITGFNASDQNDKTRLDAIADMINQMSYY